VFCQDELTKEFDRSQTLIAKIILHYGKVACLVEICSIVVSYHWIPSPPEQRAELATTLLTSHLVPLRFLNTVSMDLTLQIE
jgi:hypothetical protein